MSDSPLPQTLAECQALITNQQSLISQQQATLVQQQATIAEQQVTIDEQQGLLKALQNDIALFKRSLFGPRRERYEDPSQRLLFDFAELGEAGAEASEETSDLGDEEPATKKPRSRGRVRRVIPECLPRIPRYQELNEDDIPEELRGQPGRRFFKKASEWIEWQPPQLFVVEEYVEVLAVDNQDATETAMISAPKELRLLNCFVGPAMLAYFVASRFADHQPYYRLEEILLRSGIKIDRSTLCRWIVRLAFLVLPLVDRMRQLALMSAVAQADETSVKQLDPGQGKTSTSYLWAVLGDSQYPFTTFYFTEDHSRAGPDAIFADFEGVLLSDAYICYEITSADSDGRIELAGCHAHARRKFEELHHLAPTERTATALGYFQRLFLIEDELLDLSDEDRHEQRQLRSRPLMDDFKAWLDQQLETLTPRHELRGAIEYMTKRWECFERFLESGAIPIHNNATEQAIKVAVMGKKAWLFFGSPEGGEAAAIFYTLTTTCRRLKIDPLAYLSDVFKRLPLCDLSDPTSLNPLLPDRWLSEHPEARLPMREKEARKKAERKRSRRAQIRRALARADAAEASG